MYFREVLGYELIRMRKFENYLFIPIEYLTKELVWFPLLGCLIKENIIPHELSINFLQI